MKLSEHFTFEEVTCKCGCGFDEVDLKLIDMLENVRAHFGKPVNINSACRCEARNKTEDGGKRSQHLLGKAADIRVSGVMPKDVYDFINAEYPICGLGSYKTFTHVDCRDYRARW